VALGEATTQKQQGTSSSTAAAPPAAAAAAVAAVSQCQKKTAQQKWTLTLLDAARGFAEHVEGADMTRRIQRVTDLLYAAIQR
jgi:hypothetical protein